MAYKYEINGQVVEFEREPTEADIDSAAEQLRSEEQPIQQLSKKQENIKFAEPYTPTKEYLLPQFVTGAKFRPGERNIYGDIGERPGKALTSLFTGQGYSKGALFPEETKSFLERSQETSIGRPDQPVQTFFKGLGRDIVATAADIAIQPANVIPGSAMGIKKFQEFSNVIAKTKPVKGITDFFTAERSFLDIAGNIRKRMPKFNIHNDKWIVKQAEQGQYIADGIQEALSSSYSKMYGKIGDIPIDPNKIDEILLNSNIDDTVIRSLDKITGGTRIDNISKAKDVVDLLNKLTPASFYRAGGTIGKGGGINQKILNMRTYKAIKDEIKNAVASIDKNTANQLQKLDTFAHDKVYPTLDKMRSMFGTKEIPSTESIQSVFGGAIGKASQRETLRKIPQLSDEFKLYISQEYKKDLDNVIGNSKQLIKEMNSFRKRELGRKWGLRLGGAVAVEEIIRRQLK